MSGILCHRQMLLQPAAAASGDPYYNSVKMLLEFDGTNGQTTFTDFGPTSSVPSSNNGAAVSTTRQKFGTGSLLLNGTNQYVSTSRGIGIGTGAFTLEAHVRPTAAQAGRVHSCQSSGSTNAVIFLRVNADGSIQIFLRDSAGAGALNLSSAAGLIAMNDTAWYHIAATRQGASDPTPNRVDLWVDGVSVANSSSTTSPNNAGNVYQIGAQYGTAEFYKGYIDNARITEGICRYIGSYTPPAAAYPHSL